MTQIILFKQWFGIAKFILAILLVAMLLASGLHPVWGIALLLYRRAAFRICVFLGLLYWLTHNII